jgi:hypothetical protein|tara:strand:- start:1692 stop:1826 length:135 start_codon:yes stop_codon:yes gene_type:complete
MAIDANETLYQAMLSQPLVRQKDFEMQGVKESVDSFVAITSPHR